MLLQGAYSAKYRAAFQEKLDNLKDEERQEFNVKLEKTRELSRDTNRRRRALEERRKNYEAEEERKRREILAQRKKEIQEATEKFQRSNFVRSRKKIKHSERTTPTKTVKHDNTRPVSAKAPKVINGKPYYPSVEEVMALLHVDRADVIDRLSSGDSQPRDQNADVIEPTDITAEQREQEKLRSQVVGRIQPKLAFTDEAKDITSGVLPTTIRRNSPSGSLSSIDSLDAVPDEELESMPASTGSPIAGIIRKGNKVKRDSRVTFNENVAFSDGVVGTLKRKQGTESMAMQKSYFELPDNSTSLSGDNGNESKPKVNGAGLESSKDSLILNHYLSSQSKSNIPMTTAPNYPRVNVSDMGTTGVMTYSMASNSNIRQPGGNLTPTVTTSEPRANALYVLSNSPRANGISHVGYGDQTTGSQTGSAQKNNGSEEDYSRSIGNQLQQNNREGLNSKSYVGYTSHTQKNNGSDKDSAWKTDNLLQQNNRDEMKSKTYMNESSHNEVNRFNERPTSSLPFSSINASMLKDSLEMHNDLRVSQSDSNISQGSTKQAQQPRVETRPPNPENFSSGYISTHTEIPPETPLIPVTKRDFLSKALRSDIDNGVPSTSDVNMDTMSYHTRNQASKEGVTVDGRIESNTNSYYSDGNPVSSAEQVTSRGGYSMYGQEREVPQNSRILPEQSEGKRLTQTVLSSNGMRDNAVPSAHNTKHNSDISKPNEHNDSQKHYNTVDSRGVRENIGSSSTTVGIPCYTGITYPNGPKNSLNQGHHGIQRPNRTIGESSSAIPPRSRADLSTANNSTTQNTLGSTSTTNQPSYRPSLGNGQQNFASRKPSSADELLKSVQENIERLSMTPSSAISRTNSSSVNPTSHNNGLYKPTTSASHLNRTNSENGRRPKASEKANMPESRGSMKSAAITRERKLSNRKVTNGQKSKPGEGKKVNGNTKRFHTSGSDSGIGNQRSAINMDNGETQNSNNEMANTNSKKHLSTCTNGSRVHSAHPNPKTDYQSPTYQGGNRYGVPSETRGLHPQPNTFERKQRLNSEGLAFLDKTPTDEEINHLWETVRTCLKHEQPQKAASDSAVNNVRYSRSDSGPLVGNHYLIDGNAWAPKANASDNETRFSRGTASNHFRRQGSLDSLQRRGSAESAGYMPPRRGSLLRHRNSTSERRIAPRNSQAGRPPVNPQYLHSLRGPQTSSRGPVKSNTTKTEGRPQLSYAEFQAVMQASADIKTRNTEGDTKKKSHQGVHQPIIMNHRKETSALSLEEKRLLESLDRLNERLKVQEAFAGKIVKSPRNANIQTNKTSSSKLLQPSASSSRFGSSRSTHDKVNTNTSGLLNRR